MENKENLTPQPEIYKCDCCSNYSITKYGVDIVVDFEDDATADGFGFREWPLVLCRHCYYRWFDGQMSTGELIMRCNINYDLERKLKEAKEDLHASLEKQHPI